MTAIAAGDHTTVALTAGGAVYVWGDGACGTGSCNPGQPVAALAGSTAIGVAWQRVLATRADGAVVRWDGTVATPISGISGATALDGAYDRGLGAAGGNAATFRTEIGPPFTATTVLTGGVVAIAAGTQTSVNDSAALRSDGTVWVWRADPPSPPVPLSWQGQSGDRPLTLATLVEHLNRAAFHLPEHPSPSAAAEGGIAAPAPPGGLLFRRRLAHFYFGDYTCRLRGRCRP